MVEILNPLVKDIRYVTDLIAARHFRLYPGVLSALPFIRVAIIPSPR